VIDDFEVIGYGHTKPEHEQRRQHQQLVTYRSFEYPETQLAYLQPFKPSNILCIVAHVGDEITTRSSNGYYTVKREVMLIDDSQHIITATFINDLARMFSDPNIARLIEDKYYVLSIHNVVPEVYNAQLRLTITSENNVIVHNPVSPRCDVLRKWYMAQTYNDNVSRYWTPMMLSTLTEISRSNVCLERLRYFAFEGCIDEIVRQKIIYRACGACECNNDNDGGGGSNSTWKTTTPSNYRYAIQLKVSDCSCVEEMVTTDAAGRALMGGVSADDLLTMRTDKINQLMHDVFKHVYRFVCTVERFIHGNKMITQYTIGEVYRRAPFDESVEELLYSM